MKCDLCDKEATVHELTKKAGQKIEKHLCEECARKQGLVIQPQQQITQLITQLIGTAKPGTPQAQMNPTVQIGACPSCSTTYAQFRHSGLLGCPSCYKAFEAQLGPLLQRAHEGGTHHTGKAPAAGPVATPRITPELAAAPPVPPAPDPSLEVARTQQIKGLREDLAAAIAAEEYERAATIRDQIAALERSPRQPHGGASGT